MRTFEDMFLLFALTIIYGSIFVYVDADSSSFTPQIFYLDRAGNKKYEDHMAFPFNSPATVVCQSPSPEYPLTWYYAKQSHFKFHQVNQTHHLALNKKNGESSLNIDRAQFSMSGIYQCSTNLSSHRIRIYVYGIDHSSSATVKVNSKQIELRKHKFNATEIAPNQQVQLSCRFRVGQVGAASTTVRWSGGLFGSTRSDLYELSQHRDMDDGVIIANLTIKHLEYEPGLYGTHTCSFNVIPGSMDSASLTITIPPVSSNSESTIVQSSGSLLNYTCNIIANPDLDQPIQWAINGHPLAVAPDGKVAYASNGSSLTGLRVESGHRINDRLLIDNVQPDKHRAVYTCFSANSLGNTTLGFYLRVRESSDNGESITPIMYPKNEFPSDETKVSTDAKWTILWPLFGILLELVLLVVIIVVYEIRQRRKAKREMDEYAVASSSNQPTFGPSSRPSNDEIMLRQRTSHPS